MLARCVPQRVQVGEGMAQYPVIQSQAAAGLFRDLRQTVLLVDLMVW